MAIGERALGVRSGGGCQRWDSPPTLVQVHASHEHLPYTQCEAGYIVDKRLEVVGNYDGSIRRGLNNYAC